ncbi:MAG TPA: GAF domain-containing protein [Anaerolineales bacterium]|jgi:serine phosphatase RsbU (regulator of sigma subunit)/putative methionine-R-sulfoxide reductase with GAF domain
MPAASRSTNAWDWRQLARLGERLVNDSSLKAQQQHILAAARRLIAGRVDVWLNENLFRLPDWEQTRRFPAQPPLEGMRGAVQKGRSQVHHPQRKAKTAETYAAFPLEDQGLILGALQVTRSKGPRLSPEELLVLEGLVRIVSVGLFASHRVEVERFRRGQLNLVRDVSAQIASVLDVDELARRVTELIQKTFHFYYVAIFTLEPNSKALRFRASASAPRKGRKKAAIALDVELGQGLIGQSVESGDVSISDDVRADPRYRFIDSLPETRSEVVIPLKIEDRVLGVLDVQSNRRNAFHANDLLILNALADSVARAVESARLYGALRRRAEQLALVADVSKSVTSTLDLRQLMQDAALLIHERFGFPYVHMFSVHSIRRLIEYEAGSGKRSKNLDGFTLALDDPQGIIAWVGRNGQTVLANDVTADPRYRPSGLPPKNTRAELAVPLKFGDKVLGVLDIQSDQLNAFNDDDRLMFEAVGDTIAAAIRNADLYRSERWRRSVADSLREVAGLLSANVGVDQVLESILAELERNLPVDVSAIWLLGENGLFLAAAHGADPLAIENARLTSADASIALTGALLEASPVIRKETDPIGPSGLAAGYDANYSSMAASMHLGDQPLGLIALAHPAPGRYGHAAQTMIATFASYAAVAIENARLYDTAQEQAYASAALLQVAQAVVTLSDLDEILATIIRIMPILVGVQRAGLYLWDAVGEAFLPSHDYELAEEGDSIIWNREFPAGSFPLLDAAREQNALVTHVLSRKSKPRSWLKIQPQGGNTEQHLLTNDRLLIAVPLSIKSDLFGVLLVEEADDGRRFRARRIEIINGMAQQAALAIQNDRLQAEMVVRERLETEIQLARQIQQTFIPQTLPAPAGWQLSARWRTAREVGGDFYDVLELPGNLLGLFIADVADKGVPAALFMALTRTLVRAAVIETESPAEALRRVNDLLVPDTQQGMFVTAVYGVLDLAAGLFTYANAGHNPPLWVRAGDGSVERLTRTGIALGAVEDSNMTEKSVQLAPGDSLLLYTDGVTEAFDADGDLFGESRLIESLQQGPNPSADALLETVEMHLNAFIGSTPLGDDLTMLAVRRQ